MKEPPIDKAATEGKIRLSDLRWDIVFEDVTFYYPTRPDVIVLENFSWRIRPGQNLAIVGMCSLHINLFHEKRILGRKVHDYGAVLTKIC